MATSTAPKPAIRNITLADLIPFVNYSVPIVKTIPNSNFGLGTILNRSNKPPQCKEIPFHRTFLLLSCISPPLAFAVSLAHLKNPTSTLFTFLWSCRQQKYFVFFFSECDYS